MKDECLFLEENSTDLDHEDLVVDQVLNMAFTRSIETIGEASKSIPDDFKKDVEIF